MSIVLYSYFRSSAAYRVRIALNLKKIDYEIRAVHLVKDGGEQFIADYLALNPQGRVPVLVVGDKVITQSTAIIEYLEEVYPRPALLPSHADEHAYVRSLAQIIACDIHPLNNIRVLKYLEANSTIDTKGEWYRHWIQEGFVALEQLLLRHNYSGQFCFANSPGIADAFLIPQVYNALRYGCDLKEFPLISGIYHQAMKESAFSDAAPENQPDAETV